MAKHVESLPVVCQTRYLPFFEDGNDADTNLPQMQRHEQDMGQALHGKLKSQS